MAESTSRWLSLAGDEINLSSRAKVCEAVGMLKGREEECERRKTECLRRGYDPWVACVSVYRVAIQYHCCWQKIVVGCCHLKRKLVPAGLQQLQWHFPVCRESARSSATDGIMFSAAEVPET